MPFFPLTCRPLLPVISRLQASNGCLSHWRPPDKNVTSVAYNSMRSNVQRGSTTCDVRSSVPLRPKPVGPPPPRGTTGHLGKRGGFGVRVYRSRFVPLRSCKELTSPVTRSLQDQQSQSSPRSCVSLGLPMPRTYVAPDFYNESGNVRN